MRYVRTGEINAHLEIGRLAMLGTWLYAAIYGDESLYPITIVDTDDIQAPVIVVARRTRSSVISARVH